MKKVSSVKRFLFLFFYLSWGIFAKSGKIKELSLSRGIQKTCLGILICAGVIRLGLGFSQGIVDMEWWKVWGHGLKSVPVSEFYGPTDELYIEEYKSKKSPPEIFKKLGNTIVNSGYAVNYTRVEYPVLQPPLFLLMLKYVTKVYALIDPETPNSRFYNFLINLIPFFSATAISVASFLFFRNEQSKEYALIIATSTFLFPLLWLNSPIQGYMDLPLAFCALASLMCLARDKLKAAYFFFTVGIFIKPTIVIILPAIFITGLIRHRFKNHVTALLLSLGTSFVFLLPFLLTQRFLSFITAMLSIRLFPNAISVQTLNFWWPANYLVGIVQAFQEGYNLTDSVIGSHPYVKKIQNFPSLNEIFNLNLSPLGSWIFYLVGAIVIYVFSKRVKSDAKYTLIFGVFMALSYVIFKSGVHTNHYFFIVPALILSAKIDEAIRRPLCWLSIAFIFQDLIFWGLGRDFDRFGALLSTFKIWILTIPVSILVCFLFFLTIYKIRNNFPGRQESV